MINAEEGTVTISGTVGTLVADLGTIVASLKKSGIPTAIIRYAIDVGIENAHLGRSENEEDKKLADEFMSELLKQVKEKREKRMKDAQKD